jgi:D-methionine transport system ATP-binding protein
MNAHPFPVPTPPAPVLADASAPPMIRFEGVAKTYPARRGKPGVEALRGLDFTIARGAITGVIGRSGAGKSSLVRLINGLEKPSAGRVVVDGRPISELKASELRLAQRGIGMIFQHFNLLSSRTAAANVALPLEIAGWAAADIAARVEELLDLVGIADKRDRYPSELSGGQKQRVGIARALATRPDVLLSDEATSALDPQTTRAILDLLADINRRLGVTIVLITHEMSVVRQLAQEVMVIDGGVIVERGPVADIFTRPQHEVTRTFLAETVGEAVPVSLAARLSPAPVAGGRTVLRVTLTGTEASDVLVGRLAQALAADVPLLSARVDEIAGRHVGSLIVAVPDALADRALALLAADHVTTEPLGHVE